MSVTQPFSFELAANVRGGAAYVLMVLKGGAGPLSGYPVLLTCKVYPNQGCIA